MHCLPTESERGTAALAQGLAAVFFFIPPWVARRSSLGRRSPYVGYWTRVSVIWSVFALVVLGGAIAGGILFDTETPVVLVILIHVILCVMGAFAASFNIPFGYVFVATLFCPDDYKALRMKTLARHPFGEDW